jgi:O-antigen/teichoic acid export membrane protein
LPVFVLGATFGAEIVGFLAMADRLMRAPINITTNTMRQVVLQKFSEIWNAGRPIRTQLTRTVVVLAVLVIVPLTVFWTSGEELLAFILGDRWRTAGRYIEILSPYLVVGFLGAPFQAATAAMRRQRLWFWMEMCTALSRLTIIPVAALDGATPEMVLRVYVWVTVSTKLLSLAIVFSQVPRIHPGLSSEPGH